MNKNILICPKWVKNNRGLKEFFSPCFEYRGENVSFEFVGNVFEEAIENFTDYFDSYEIKIETLSFKNVIFQKYVRFDNLQCINLEFIDVYFEKGGGIKRKRDNGFLQIATLVFKPFQVQNDFVIDLGMHANENGLLEIADRCSIQNIEFENHKDGNGKIYFIGIHKDTDADFRNMMLDNVFFQGSDFTNTCFLNAKIDKTEFHNCIFPEIRNHKYVNMLDEKWNVRFIQIGFVVITISMYIFVQQLFLDQYPILFNFILFFIPFYLLIALFSLNAWFHPFEYFFGNLLKMTNLLALNKVQGLHHHFGTKDEVLINEVLLQFAHKSKMDQDYFPLRNQLQHSYFSLIELYKQLKENFGKNDFQTAGNFFYSQRYMEMISVTYKKSLPESWVLNVHCFVNGFGERFMRPLILLITTIVLFAWIPELAIPKDVLPKWMNLPKAITANKDYIATSSTPMFLLQVDDRNKSCAPILMDANQSITLQVQNEKQKNFYLDKKIDNNATISFAVPKLKEDWHTAFYYSLSHFNDPFLSDNRQWFQEVSEKAIFWGWVERGLLWLFSVAFALAVFHRIKR